MTDAARYNMQHGVPEDRRFEHTTYTVENEIDWYAKHLVETREMVEQYHERERKKRMEMELKKRQEKEEKEMVERMEKQIEKEIEKNLDKILSNLLKDFK